MKAVLQVISPQQVFIAGYDIINKTRPRNGDRFLGFLADRFQAFRIGQCILDNRCKVFRCVFTQETVDANKLVETILK